MKTVLPRKLISLVAFAFLLISYYGSAQSSASSRSGFRLSIENISLTSDRTLQFDLYLLDTDAKDPLELALVQAGILVNPELFQGGSLSASIVAGSSQLIVEQQPTNILFSDKGNIIKLPSRTLKPLAKDSKSQTRGTIISAKIPGTRICSIKLTNTIAFTKAPARLAFNFSKVPYPTSLFHYTGGINTPLFCNETNCVVKYQSSK